MIPYFSLVFWPGKSKKEISNFSEMGNILLYFLLCLENLEPFHLKEFLPTGVYEAIS